MLVGMGGTSLDFLITYLLKEKGKWNKYLANSIGFMTAATSNYIFNRIWAFKSQSSQVMAQYLVFVTISLIGLGLMNFLIWVFHEKWKINFYVAKVCALIFVLVWTFSAHYLVTFSRI